MEAVVREKSTSENWLDFYHVIKRGHLLIGSLYIYSGPK